MILNAKMGCADCGDVATHANRMRSYARHLDHARAALNSIGYGSCPATVLRTTAVQTQWKPFLSPYAAVHPSYLDIFSSCCIETSTLEFTPVVP